MSKFSTDNMQAASETTQLIEETARRVLSAHCSSDQLKAAEGAWSEALWRDLDAAGLASALQPDGSDATVAVADALSIVCIAGSFGTPAPLVENLLANWLAASAGLSVTPGPLTIAPVNREDRLDLRRLPSGWHLSGVATRVPWARYAAGLVIIAKCDEHYFLVMAPASAFLEIEPGENLAREPRDRVVLDGELSDAAAVPFAAGIEHVYVMGAAMRVLQMAGALDAVLRLTVQYAQQRKQFGRPLSKFQAVQQNVAVMAANIAAARAAANSVVNIIAENGSQLGIVAAKLRTNEAATIAAKLAHQVHGAMGFTQEYELHFLTKRLWSWRDEFGNEAVWARALGSAVCERGADQLWAFITSEMG